MKNRSPYLTHIARSLFSLALALVFLTPIYEGYSLVPKFYISESSQGTYKVYDAKQIVVPKYIVKPTPSGYDVFKPESPLIPIYKVPKLNLGR